MKIETVMILFYYENIDLNYSNNQSILKEIIPGISFFFFLILIYLTLQHCIGFLWKE